MRIFKLISGILMTILGILTLIIGLPSAFFAFGETYGLLWSFISAVASFLLAFGLILLGTYLFVPLIKTAPLKLPDKRTAQQRTTLSVLASYTLFSMVLSISSSLSLIDHEYTNTLITALFAILWFAPSFYFAVLVTMKKFPQHSKAAMIIMKGMAIYSAANIVIRIVIIFCTIDRAISFSAMDMLMGGMRFIPIIALAIMVLLNKKSII